MRILLGLSGGVDSTYAAHKLIEEGHNVEAAVLIMHKDSPERDASESACALGIPLHVIDCSEDFDRIVIGNFIEEYKRARTPNPCVICNSEIKFVKLYEYAVEHGFDAIATGHYARINAIDKEGNVYPKTVELQSEVLSAGKIGEYRYALSFGTDPGKDQTYMLWRLSQCVLSRLVFPLSDSRKFEVKASALESGLVSATRPESQEICFVPDGDYAAFIEERSGKSPEGDFIDECGRVLGRHKGIIRYTKGQRRGLGISAASRIFVTDIDPVKNTVTVSRDDSYATEVRVSDVVYSGMEPPEAPTTCRLCVKLRYAAPRVPCEVTFCEGGEALVRLDVPARAVTDGQSAVFYDGDLVVAGGFINASK